MKVRGDLYEVSVVFIAIAVIVVFVVIFAYEACVTQPQLKEQCEARGGRVIEIHGSRSGWMCQERAP